ncbi:GntR family transcriptional regulator [Actinoplanes lobatus]|nr:GntR family transcriptional regulator [Actinoplanes lobatus]GIE40997.1 GntR family transcriptional regulator [Actinoplanes lobatus]
MPPLEIDRRSPVPLYFQIGRRIEEAIERGELAPGEKLPTEIELAATLDISRPTVRRAIEELVGKGLLTRRRGVGTRVTDVQVRRRIALTSLYDDLVAAGRQPLTRVLRFGTDRVDRHAARMLGLPGTEQLVHCERLRLADGAPLALLRNWLPPRFADLTADALATHGLYRMMAERNGRPAVARQRITAKAATPEQARLLDIGPHTPLISMQRTSFDSTGTAVEYADNLYRADHYAIEVTVFNR